MNGYASLIAVGLVLGLLAVVGLISAYFEKPDEPEDDTSYVSIDPLSFQTKATIKTPTSETILEVTNAFSPHGANGVSPPTNL